MYMKIWYMYYRSGGKLLLNHFLCTSHTRVTPNCEIASAGLVTGNKARGAAWDSRVLQDPFGTQVKPGSLRTPGILRRTSRILWTYVTLGHTEPSDSEYPWKNIISGSGYNFMKLYDAPYFSLSLYDGPVLYVYCYKISLW